MTKDVLRFGVLGAARITPKALIDASADVHSMQITRVAARDEQRATAFAEKHKIPSVSESYQALIEADDVDVVYNPLPMNLHAEWSIAALRAGKHVLCEKPFASNAAEAQEMVDVASTEGLILGEAFHHWYHPMFQHIVDVTQSGVIGSITHAAGYFNVTIPEPDIRWDYETSGGSLMDLGCYPLHWVRHVLGEEPTVSSATETIGPDHIDADMKAELSFPGGATAHIESSMIQPSTKPKDVRLEVTGTKGSITVINPLSPQSGNSVTIRSETGESTAEFDAGSTYAHMVRAFCNHVTHGLPFPTKGHDAIDNMAAIDAIYTASGLPIRGLSNP